MQPWPAHPRGVSAGPRMGAGGFPGGRRGKTGVLGKMVELSSVEGPYSETPALGPRAGEGFPELPGPGGPGSAASSLLRVIPRPCPRWENKDIYAAAIRSLRLRELQNVECVTAVRAGLGAIIPLQLLTTLSPLEMELRTCGLPYINLEFLKVGGQARLAGACSLLSVQYSCVLALCPLM